MSFSSSGVPHLILTTGFPNIPLAASPVAAGFPSPAQDYREGTIDLNRALVRHPEATFCVVAKGESMTESGIHDGDILVVDRSVTPRQGAIAVCVVDGDFTVKHVHREGTDGVVLRGSHPSFPPLRVRSEQDFQVWGAVTWILHRADRR
jgi:DNA polymerase V